MTFFRAAALTAALLASLVVTSDASAAPEPTISSVGVSLPSTTDQSMPPAQKFVRLSIHFSSMPEGCAGQEFRYANEDGNWVSEPVYIQRPYVHQSAGFGYKGVYVQYWGNCSTDGTGTAGPIGNIVYTRYTLPRPAAAVPNPATSSEPKITAVTVGLPTKPVDGQYLPSQFLPSVHVTFTTPDGCHVTGMRYANEDGNWQGDSPSLTRPLIHPSAGYGYKGVYTQVMGYCDDGHHVMSNIVYTRYTLVKLAA